MTATRWPDVVDALVTATRVLPGYRAAADDAPSSDVLVLDGPEVWLTGDDAPRLLVIGWTLDDDRDQGDAGQAVATLGKTSRDETGVVLCQALAQTGSLELPDPNAGPGSDRLTAKVLRDRAFAVFADVADLVRADPTLGIVAPRMFAQVGARMTPRQFLTESGGAVVSVEFEIAYDTRI